MRTSRLVVAIALALPVAVVLALPALAGGGGHSGGKPVPSNSQAPPTPPAADKPAGIVSPNAVRDSTSNELVFGAPLRYENLTLVPVGTRQQGPFQKYTLLEQGVAAKTFAVREIDGQANAAQVHAVEVRNTGKDPVYLLGGEMILGGKQDRIIERDTVISAADRWVQVPVFCVEAHRWTGQNMDFGAGGALVHVALREAALSGDQSKVWEEVARKNAQQGTESQSGTYRRTIQNPEVRAKIRPYRDKLLAMMFRTVNGRLTAAEALGHREFVMTRLYESA